ncbi:hypothetical protein HNR42_002887 [Deinobacterium chartae]|uniref:Lipoprotein n=1 Tax=Deinobacterium chartae TaxID=521158 RepID=A0A841I316_9DEIO|nr:hypothetical protein [Deinobacterium chartae]MBB6099446.1 hypothetical protein [Deinobacterium chartae]
MQARAFLLAAGGVVTLSSCAQLTQLLQPDLNVSGTWNGVVDVTSTATGLSGKSNAELKIRDDHGSLTGRIYLKLPLIGEVQANLSGTRTGNRVKLYTEGDVLNGSLTGDVTLTGTDIMSVKLDARVARLFEITGINGTGDLARQHNSGAYAASSR